MDIDAIVKSGLDDKADKKEDDKGQYNSSLDQ